MAYDPIRKYGDKDQLPSGDPGKVIYGAELDEEFEAISTDMTEFETTLQEKWEAVSGDIPGVGEGDEDGETLMWNEGTERWEKNDLLKIQPVDGEVIVDNMLVTQSVDPDTGASFIGHHGMVYQSEVYNNANDPWSGENGKDWEVGFVRPRDDDSNPNRKNGFDVVSDRFTVRLTRDYATSNWWESQIVFRADGEEVEIGARNNTSSVFTNGDVYVGHQPDNRPDNSDTQDGTLFCKQGIIVGRGNGGGASIGMEGNVIFNLGDPISNDQAVNLGYLKNHAVIKSGANVAEAADYEFTGRDYSVGEFIDAQVEANDSVYDQLLTHSLQIEALQNNAFEALKASSTFEEFKQQMIAVLSDLTAEAEKSKFERPGR